MAGEYHDSDFNHQEIVDEAQELLSEQVTVILQQTISALPN